MGWRARRSRPSGEHAKRREPAPRDNMMMPCRVVKGHAAMHDGECPAPGVNRRKTVACYRRDVQTDAMPTSRQDGAARSEVIGATWLGRVPYREAWALQKQLAARRADGAIGDRLLLLEHPPVLTLGRGADEGHVLASAADLAARGIEVIR